MIEFVGVDGCRSGWYAVTATSNPSSVTGCEHERFSELLAAYPRAVIAIDIPIGLPDAGLRACDQLARSFLKPYRSASVFTAPLRPMLHATTHSEASGLRRTIEGKGMSIQAFAIMPKIREVDSALQASPDAARVYEVHPEVSFARLNGQVPMKFSKKSAAGREERIALLERQFPGVPRRLVESRRPAHVAADDVLDALVVLWSARRIAKGEAVVLEGTSTHDRVGRRMSISS